MGKGDTPHDLRRAYPQLEPDREYPPLHLQSLKGKVSAAEWEARVDCACAYRLVKHFGMDDLIYNHISARIPGSEERAVPSPRTLARTSFQAWRASRGVRAMTLETEINSGPRRT